MDKTERIAKDLFERISNFITKTMFEENWPKAKGKLLSLVNLSTHEKWARNEPWNGIFYLRFFYSGRKDEEKPVIVGIGSFRENQITVDADVVPKSIRDLFGKFGFDVVAPVNPHMPFKDMERDILPHYQ